MNWANRNLVLKAALLLGLVASMATFVLLIAISTRALLQADANGFMLLAFLSLLALVGVLAAWKRNTPLILFSSLFLLPYGLYTPWGFGSIFGLIGPFIVLFVLSSFLMLRTVRSLLLFLILPAMKSLCVPFALLAPLRFNAVTICFCKMSPKTAHFALFADT